MAVDSDTGRRVMWCYIGLAFGDFGSGYLSQRLRSRKKAWRCSWRSPECWC
jgi:hypothetical protein